MKTDEQVLQFRVELQDITPPVWRRIQVPSWYSLWDLHVAIQDAMGWQDRHLHAFRFPGEEWKDVQFGIPNESDGSEEELLQSDIIGWYYAADTLFRKTGDTAVYEYDFGDGWLHGIVFEGSVPAEKDASYPRCIDGARACPPEDCGGPPGYDRLLGALESPEDEEARELVSWLECGVVRYPPFEPERFDIAELRFEDPGRHWKKVFLGDEGMRVPLPRRRADGRPYCPTGLSPEEQEIDDIFFRLYFRTGDYEYGAVEQAIARRDRVIPELVELLTHALRHPEEVAEDPEYFGHLYAFMLAGHLRVVETHDLIARLLALPDDLPYHLFSYLVNEAGPAVLLRTCDGNLDAIHGLAADRTASMIGRMAAVDAIVYAVTLGFHSREEALRLLAALLDNCEPDDGLGVASAIVYGMVQLYPGEYIERLETAWDEGMVDPLYLDRQAIDEVRDMDMDECLAALHAKWKVFSLDDIHLPMQRWISFDLDEDDLTDPVFDDPLPVVPVIPREAKKKKNRRKTARSSRKKNRKKK